MSRSALKFFAVVLSVLIVVVLFAGLDDLPRTVRAQIEGERRAVATAQTQFRAAQEEVAGDLRSEPELFRAVPASQQWTSSLERAGSDLGSAARDSEELARLGKQNRRQDAPRVASLIVHERGLRAGALAQALAVQKDAAGWVDLKRRLPQKLQEMEREHAAIHAFDLAGVRAAVEKAETDWPDKKPDLESRLNVLGGAVSQSDSLWQASAEARRRAAAGDLSGIAIVGADANALETRAANLPKQAEELKALAGQLYTGWDKLLVDMEVRGIGTARAYDQKIRTVRTHTTDAAAKTAETTSDEAWVDVSQATYEAMRNNLGMAIEHKPAGKYDFEAERVAQPAGFAYMASPAQGSNQYGHWEHRDGRDFWVFYGQYALMRDLLFNRSYRPLDRGEWDGYRTSQQRGQTYYGRDEAAGAPKYGSQGTATQDRYSGSSYAQGGGFRDSKYASKSGSYGSSKYATPGGDRTPRKFGSSSGSQEPHAAPPPSRTYRPAPRSAPSYHPPMRSPGRTFGRRR